MSTDELRIPGRRRPAAIVVGILLGLAIWLAWPESAAEVVDCGPADGDSSSWRHDSFCTLTGTVESANVVSMGKSGTGQGAAKLAGVRWFVKLHGADVVVALPASRADVFKWHQSHEESLLGFQIDGVGRLFDPDLERGYGGMGKALRKTLGVSPDRHIWVFDTGDAPR